MAQASLVERIAYRYLLAKSGAHAPPERKPIKVTKGYHLTPSRYIDGMLDKGVAPRSKGNLKGEFERDKTYFFRDLDSAVESMLDYMRAEGKPLKFDSKDTRKFQQAIVEFDLNDQQAFADPEMPDEAGFITKKLPNSAVKLVKFKDWEPALTSYGKKHKVKVSFPSDDNETSESDSDEGAPREPPKTEKPRLEQKAPSDKPKVEHEPKPDHKSTFLKERGDQQVRNPNPDSRERFPTVKLRSLDWKYQKPYYEKWKRVGIR